MGVYIGPAMRNREDYETVEDYCEAWNRMVDIDEAHGYKRLQRKDPLYERDLEEAMASL
jgi:hypothetical protein